MSIKTFAADGRRLRSHSFESVARLEQLKLVIVQRNRKGDILCAHFYGQTRTPLTSRLKAGTRYSYRELVGDGRRRWSHSKLPRIPLSPALSDSEFAQELHIERAKAFAAVCLSVTRMTEPEPVVSIENFRPRELPVSTSLPDKLAA